MISSTKPTISKHELDKVDIRVGRIELVEDVLGSDKLIRLTVDAALNRYASFMKRRSGKRVTFDEVIGELLEEANRRPTA